MPAKKPTAKSSKEAGKKPARKVAKKAAKKTAKKVARKAAKKVAGKAARTAAPRTRKSPSKTADVSAEARREMIAEAAYYRAEKRSFQGGDPVADWLICEKEINGLLSKGAH